MATTLGALNPFRYRSYVYDEETSLYYLRSRYYNPTWGRFVNADELIARPGGILVHNLFVYTLNDPINSCDFDGTWPNWLESIVKVVSIVAVVVAAVAVVATVTVATAGTATIAASIALGTATGGLVGGIANENKGESFINGWCGGALNGTIQTTGTLAFGYTGTIIGGSIGSGLGTALTESMNNQNKPKDERKTASQIAHNSIQSAEIALMVSPLTAFMQYSLDSALLTQAGGLMPELSRGFVEMQKVFFGAIDDGAVYALQD